MVDLWSFWFIVEWRWYNWISLCHLGSNLSICLSCRTKLPMAIWIFGLFFSCNH